MRIEVAWEENTNQPPHRSLDEIKAALREMQASRKLVDAEYEPVLNGPVKVDAEEDELLFVGEAGAGHNCRAMRCGLNEHILFRARFANILMTRKAKRLLRSLVRIPSAGDEENQ